MRKNIKLFKSIIFLSILLITSSKAELTNKVIMSVGNEIITNYDMARELKYLNVITVGQLKNLDAQKVREMATDSLIKDKVKIAKGTTIKSHSYIQGAIIKEDCSIGPYARIRPFSIISKNILRRNTIY